MLNSGALRPDNHNNISKNRNENLKLDIELTDFVTKSLDLVFFFFTVRKQRLVVNGSSSNWSSVLAYPRAQF